MNEGKTKTVVYDDYTINSAWSIEDDCFVARVLERNSLATHGNTHDEAIEQMIEVLDAIIDEEIDTANQLFGAFVELAAILHEHKYSSDAEYRMTYDKQEQYNQTRISKLRKLVLFGEDDD